jgi:hypothetical protein
LQRPPDSTGKLSAETAGRDFEAATKELGSWAELIEHVKKCEAMARDAFDVTEELKKIAALYREEAKRVFFEIENCSLAMAEVRQTALN